MIQLMEWHVLIYLLLSRTGFELEIEPSTSKNQPFNFITSNKGNKVVLRSGYKYQLRSFSKKDGSSIWRCSRRSICNALFVLTPGNLIKREDKHDCQPDFAKNESDIIKDTCKKMVASNPNKQVASVFRDYIEKLRDTGVGVAKIPKFQSVKSGLYSTRKKSLKKSPSKW